MWSKDEGEGNRLESLRCESFSALPKVLQASPREDIHQDKSKVTGQGPVSWVTASYGHNPINASPLLTWMALELEDWAFSGKESVFHPGFSMTSCWLSLAGA